MIARLWFFLEATLTPNRFKNLLLSFSWNALTIALY